MRKFKLYIDNFSRRERLRIDDGRTKYDRLYDILPENGSGSLSDDEVINILRKVKRIQTKYLTGKHLLFWQMDFNGVERELQLKNLNIG